jgi:hypothetical protein
MFHGGRLRLAWHFAYVEAAGLACDRRLSKPLPIPKTELQTALAEATQTDKNRWSIPQRDLLSNLQTAAIPEVRWNSSRPGLLRLARGQHRRLDRQEDFCGGRAMKTITAL